MNGKLLENNNTSVENLAEKINEIVNNKFDILEKKDDIEKWNTIPNLLLLDDVAQKRLLSFIEFMDSLNTPVEDKAMLIISLSGVLEFGNIKLYDYDDGNLYTIADFYKDRTIEDIKKTISLIGNKDVLLTVRRKTLDLEIRKKLLINIEKSFLSAKISSANQITNFSKKVIKELETKEYYDLVK